MQTWRSEAVVFTGWLGFPPAQKKIRQWNAEESGNKAEEKNLRRISDEKERRIALVKREARKVPVQWDEK